MKSYLSIKLIFYIALIASFDTTVASFEAKQKPQPLSFIENYLPSNSRETIALITYHTLGPLDIKTQTYVFIRKLIMGGIVSETLFQAKKYRKENAEIKFRGAIMISWLANFLNGLINYNDFNKGKSLCLLTQAFAQTLVTCTYW